MTALSTTAADRAAGVLLAQACGDALGAPTEFQMTPLPPDTPMAMTGGGSFGWAPGEWTDDTQMSIPILMAAEQSLVDGVPLLDRLDDIAAAWVEWAWTAPDVGLQTRSVLMTGGPSATGLRDTARALHDRGERMGGNGSLMRTAPVALALLGDPAATAEAARAISELTHPDPDACVLWCAAIQHAITEGEFDASVGLAHLPEHRRDLWRDRLTEAESHEAGFFHNNGWVVHALQAAWSLLTRIPVPDDAPEHGSYPAQHLRHVLEAAARLAGDTDTVGAIAGALAGARWGASAVPAEWRRVVHGWPGLTGTDLARRGLAISQRGADPLGWPLADRVDYSTSRANGRLVQHPQDPGVWLADVAVIDDLPDDIDAVVSLCRMGRTQVPRFPAVDHVEVWLLDSSDESANPNLHFIFADAADAIAALRAEGKTVLLHCVAAQSRTPTIAAAYAIRHLGADPQQALDDVCAVLPDPEPNWLFQREVCRVAPAAGSPPPRA